MWKQSDLKVISPFQIVGVNLIFWNLGILIFICEKPAMTAALKSPMVSVHVASHVWSLPANLLSISCHVRPWFLLTIVFSKLKGHIIHVGKVVGLQRCANTCLGKSFMYEEDCVLQYLVSSWK